jgi:serine phosphatase RsbU (regulator of sigma subunit)/pSer/pThr/pTyr-binding forkhead associated (FHA) protein
MPFLTVSTPDGKTSRRDLRETRLIIGRSARNDIAVADDTVSRFQHARIERHADGDYVVHVKGKNRTAVNDKRIYEPTRLHAGDCIRVGHTRLVYNDFPTSSIEISDRPWPCRDETTIVPADELTPPPRTQVLASTDGVPASVVDMMIDADKELVLHKPLDDMFETIMEMAHRIAPFERGLIMTLEQGQLVPQWIRVPPEESESGLSVCRSVVNRVIGERESILTEDALVDPRLKGATSIAEAQIRSLVCVPLLKDGDVTGLLYVDSRRKAGLFTGEGLIALTHLAHIAATKIETRRLVDQAVQAGILLEELQKAAAIQTHLLPAGAPEIEDYQLHGTSIPCLAVGGDYYDFFELPRRRFGIAVGDVAGKGLSAALLMCSLQSSVHALTELDLSPEETMARLNGLMCRRLPINRFITYFYGILDRDDHSLSYVNAGQCHPCLVSAGGETRRLVVGGTPLGISADMEYSGGRLRFEPGDTLVCYSDGVVEGRNQLGVEFGEERILSIVIESRGESPESIIERIRKEAEDHGAHDQYEDDFTLLVLKRES